MLLVKTSVGQLAESLVVDASAMVDSLLQTEFGKAVTKRLSGTDLHAPAHLDAEVLSALGRLHRDGRLSGTEIEVRLRVLGNAPIDRHLLGGLLTGAWHRRHNLRLVDSLYVELADQLGFSLVTTDHRLGLATDIAELITLPSS